MQTQFGFHVIQVNDKREVGPPPFEQVRPQIREIVSRELYVETLRNARGEADVSIEDPALARLLAASMGASGPANDNAANDNAASEDAGEAASDEGSSTDETSEDGSGDGGSGDDAAQSKAQ